MTHNASIQSLPVTYPVGTRIIVDAATVMVYDEHGNRGPRRSQFANPREVTIVGG